MDIEFEPLRDILDVIGLDLKVVAANEHTPEIEG